MDLDDRFEAQHDRMLKEMDDRMELLPSSLLYQIKTLIDNSQSNNPNSKDASAFPGRASYHTVPEPPQPQAKTASVRNRESFVSEGSTGARASGLAHAHFDDDSLPNARAAQSPNFQGGNQDIPTVSGGSRGRREFCHEDDGVDDDDDDLDDRDHATEAPLDCAFAHLVDFIYERFPHSEPQTAAPSAPRCE